MSKLNTFLVFFFSIAFTNIMTFSSWFVMLSYQASSPIFLPLAFLIAISDSLEVLKYIIFSNASASFHMWSFCMECLPTACSKNSYLSFNFISSASVKLSPFPPGRLHCSFVEYVLCISAVKQLYIILIYLPGSC